MQHFIFLLTDRILLPSTSDCPAANFCPKIVCSPMYTGLFTFYGPSQYLSSFPCLSAKMFRTCVRSILMPVDLVSLVWPPAPSKVSLSEKLSMILGVFRCFFFDKISFPNQTVHFAIACHTYSESYCSSR